MRTFVVVLTFGLTRTPPQSTPAAFNFSSSSRPAASSPTTPTSAARAPSVARFRAQLAAPPGTVSVRSCRRIITGASRDTRLISPDTNWSAIKIAHDQHAPSLERAHQRRQSLGLRFTQKVHVHQVPRQRRMNIDRPFKAGTSDGSKCRVASATPEPTRPAQASLTRRAVVRFDTVPALKGRAKLKRR